MTEGGVEHKVLTADQARERWPFMRFDGPVIFHPQAGTLDPDAMIERSTTRDRARPCDPSGTHVYRHRARPEAASAS